MTSTDNRQRAQAYFDLLVERGLVEIIDSKLQAWEVAGDTDPEVILSEIEDPTMKMTPGQEYALAFSLATDELWRRHEALSVGGDR